MCTRSQFIHTQHQLHSNLQAQQLLGRWTSQDTTEGRAAYAKPRVHDTWNHLIYEP